MYRTLKFVICNSFFIRGFFFVVVAFRLSSATQNAKMLFNIQWTEGDSWCEFKEIRMKIISSLNFNGLLDPKFFTRLTVFHESENENGYCGRLNNETKNHRFRLHCLCYTHHRPQQMSMLWIKIIAVLWVMAEHNTNSY